jgi:putative membrane protein
LVYAALKAIHIVGVVTWFAGLFYIVRLFVYLRETQERPAAERDVLQDQLKGMAHRLWYGIAWPSAIVTVIVGTALLTWWWPPPTWLVVKLGLVALLLAYHGACHGFHRRLQRGVPVASGMFFRIWNEAATVLLVGIVFLVVLKSSMGLVWGVGGLTVLIVALMAGIVVYRRIRENRSAG